MEQEKTKIDDMSQSIKKTVMIKVSFRLDTIN